MTIKHKGTSARVLLVSANREEVNMAAWPLGLACVAAATIRAGHDVRVLDLLCHRDPLAALDAAIREAKPDVIGVSVRNIDDQRMENVNFLLRGVKSVIDRCRELTSAPIILGGAGYSIFPQSALDYLGADMGIPGEGERAFPLLVERLMAGSDPSGPYLLHRAGATPTGERGFIGHLDDYPLPDPALIPPSAYGEREFWMPVQTRRGCAMDCSYCSTPAIEGRRLRKRSAEAVAGWLGRCAAAGIRRFYFVDNTFNLPSSYALELCEAMAGAASGISWRCILYPWKVDGRLAGAMARAGCAEVSLGSESGSDDMLRSMNKRFSHEDVRRVSSVIADHGIRRTGFLLLGGPGETMKTAEESLIFADSLGLEALKITIGIRIYPGTELALRAVEEGVISSSDSLLEPRFYIAPGLEDPGRRMASEWVLSRPGWML
jgi:radical SAM superfamily enzyme YgiQ (UPF0313 family)